MGLPRDVYNPGVTLLRGALALVLSCALGARPAVAAMQERGPVLSGVAAATPPAAVGLHVGALRLQTFALTSSAFRSHGLFAPRFDGQWTDAGTVASLLRAAELASAADEAGQLSAPPPRPLA